MHGKTYENDVGRALEQNKRDFCRACGYRCMLFNTTLEQVTKRSVHWDKIQHLLRSLRDTAACEVAIWADADVVFRRPFALSPLVDRTPIATAVDVEGLNSGLMIMRRAAETSALLENAWAQERWAKSSWMGEQLALRDAVKQNAATLLPAIGFFDNIVAYPAYRPTRVSPDVARQAPTFHIATCFSRMGRFGKCFRMLRSELGGSLVGPAAAGVTAVAGGGHRLSGKASCPVLPRNVTLFRPARLRDVARASSASPKTPTRRWARALELLGF